MQPLTCKPLIECRDAAGVSLQEVAAIKIGRLPQRMDGARGYQRLESRGVDFDRRRPESNGVSFSGEQIGGKESQGGAKVARQSADIIYPK
jgi:hypothetical protein